jgi:hypothetical protein
MHHYRVSLAAEEFRARRQLMHMFKAQGLLVFISTTNFITDLSFCEPSR